MSCLEDFGGKFLYVVKLSDGLLASVDRARVQAVKQSRRDGALDHVARNHDELNASGGEFGNHGAKRIFAGALA